MKIIDIILYPLQFNCIFYSLYAIVSGNIILAIIFMFALYFVAYIQEYVIR